MMKALRGEVDWGLIAFLALVAILTICGTLVIFAK